MTEEKRNKLLSLDQRGRSRQVTALREVEKVYTKGDDSSEAEAGVYAMDPPRAVPLRRGEVW